MPQFIGHIDNVMEIVQVVNTVYFMNLLEKFIFQQETH